MLYIYILHIYICMEGEQLPSHMTFVFFVKMTGIVFGDPKAPLFNQRSPSGRTSGAKGPTGWWYDVVLG